MPTEDMVILHFSTSEGWYVLYLFGVLAYMGQPMDIEWPECIANCIAFIGRPVNSASQHIFNEGTYGARWCEDGEYDFPQFITDIPPDVWASQSQPFFRQTRRRDE